LKLGDCLILSFSEAIFEILESIVQVRDILSKQVNGPECVQGCV
jgi:hypothetical protein